jgi:hypothetical protein
MQEVADNDLLERFIRPGAGGNFLLAFLLENLNSSDDPGRAPNSYSDQPSANLLDEPWRFK